MKSKKTIIIAAAVIIVVAGGCWIFGGTKAKNKVDFATEQVQKGNVSNSITATGTIEPVTEVEVGTQVSGIIDKIYVDYNSVVKEGEVIAEMDKVTLSSDLQSAQATYDGAKAEYEYQKKLYDRNEKLHKKQLISDTDYEESLYNYQRARSTYEQSKAALAKAERNLSYATITSPIDGIVTSKDVEEGQTVASGFETPTLFTIAADLTKMQVVADVDEADIAGVTEGARVTFTVDAYPDDVFEGEVRQVRLGSTNSSSSSSSTSTTSETVVTYEVVITADNPELKLKPRLTANVTIYTLTRDNVLVVPSKALRFSPNKEIAGGRSIKNCQGEHKVWTLENNTFVAHPVKTGISDGTHTEILEGISEGTNIVTEAVVASSMPEMAPSEGEGERSPFMPGPRGNNKNKNKENN
ncbi:efflux transporter RND family MFP subunit [Bacteroides sp. CAG:1076]|jgi:HlyD family secretion protein|uniref:efflux RND transporter periplasmic adaptor subunit n=1 Tax=Phocaeicola sp. TaxID=2773926 RepID=UPI00033C4CE7|nr:efflux transporter RND family MFP subunit [Bacteroides sp. CAG:1076]